MPFMKEDVSLRVEPNGQRNGVIAGEGDEVETLGTQEIDALGGGKESWTKIRLEDADGLTEGWVPSDRIDLGGAPPNGAIDIHKFARECWWESLDNGLSLAHPYYFVAVAELRSKISGGGEADRIGPFRLTQGEWSAGRTDDSFGLGAFREKDISDWRMQCEMFSLMARRAGDLLAKELGRQPSWVELYLAQLIGPKAAAIVIKSPNDAVAKAFSSLLPADLPPGGSTADQLLDRYGDLLRDPGPPVAAVAGQAALKRIADKLQSALDVVRDVVDEVAEEFLGDENPKDNSLGKPVDKIPETPQPDGKIPEIPLGPGPASAPGAGGELGELIRKGESGKHTYGAFNRGNAGDSVKQPIDFSQMTLASIMKLQALPKRDPNRLFAIGKYQFIPVTLKGAVSALGKSPSEKLTHQLQEEFFRNYLVAKKRPAVQKYVTGKTANLAAAQLALAFEFASVARPDTGRSNYGGVAGNAASIKAKETAEALNRERAAFQRIVGGGMSEAAAWSALSPGISAGVSPFAAEPFTAESAAPKRRAAKPRVAKRPAATPPISQPFAAALSDDPTTSKRRAAKLPLAKQSATKRPAAKRPASKPPAAKGHAAKRRAAKGRDATK
jgi:hypothetical protein